MSAGSFKVQGTEHVVAEAFDGQVALDVYDWGGTAGAHLTPDAARELGEALIRLAEEAAPTPFEETLSDYGWVRVDAAYGVVRVDAHDGEERTVIGLLPAQAARIAEALAQAAKEAGA